MSGEASFDALLENSHVESRRICICGLRRSKFVKCHRDQVVLCIQHDRRYISSPEGFNRARKEKT